MYTKGPLTVRESGRKTRPWLIMAKSEWSPASCSKEDDAKLYAAAPDLLEALEAIQKWALRGDVNIQPALAPIRDIASAAIKRAKGE